MLFKGRLASMSLRQAYMLHVNVTRMCDPKGPEAAKFPLILSFPCTLRSSALPLLRLTCYQYGLRLLLFSLPLASSPSLLPPPFPCFLSITPPSSIPTSFLSFLPPYPFSLSPLYSFLTTVRYSTDTHAVKRGL